MIITVFKIGYLTIYIYMYIYIYIYIYIYDIYDITLINTFTPN